jgi:hypothetical protein
MTVISNSPTSTTIIRVEARKSFALGLHIFDPRGRTVDLSGCELTIIAKPLPLDNTSDVSNILAANAIASIAVPAAGYAVFNIQASSLDVAAQEYPCAIVLKTPDGYSGVIVKAVLDVQENPEHASVGSTYFSVNPSQSLAVLLAANGTIDVYMGGQLPPNMNYVSDATATAIEAFDPESVAYVPAGGTNGYVLTKTASGDYAMAWRPNGNGAGALNAAGVPNGQTPVAQGDGTWEWGTTGISATGVADGWAPLANGDGTWSWAVVSTATPDWNATSGQPGEILHKPALNFIPTTDAGNFVSVLTKVSALAGITFQTTVPVTGPEGQIFFVYTP